MERIKGSQVRLTIERIKGEQRTRRKDRLAVEEPLAIRVSLVTQEELLDLVVTMRTPGHDFELTAGFLYAENIIQTAEDIRHITHCLGESGRPQHYNVIRAELASHVELSFSTRRYFVAHSSCGVCGKTSIEAIQTTPSPPLLSEEPKVSAGIIHQLNAQLLTSQAVFARTGGLHAAALFDAKGALLSLREDVGRHNAVDKLIGQQLLAKQMPLQQCILLVSSRASFELVQKTIRAGIPILAAIGAPSSLAVELAEDHGMTLLGFVREERFNIYTGGERIS